MPSPEKTWDAIVVGPASTPLSTTAFTGAPRGAIYGLETTPRRFLSDSLRARTPVPGVTGAMMGGVLAAAAAEPRIFTHVSTRAG